MRSLGRLGKNDPEYIGAYRLRGVIGSGGQGTVYLGQGPSGQQVAIKMLHVRVADAAEVRRYFEREAALAQQVAVFCTAQVLEAGFSDDRPYLVSEYVPGPSLHELVAREGPRLGSGLDRLAIATATALDAIHRAGIVHRDFKPANVIMGPEGPVVIDFGIARILDATVSSQLIGTPGYMAPEQLAWQPAGPYSDVFAWAATMVYAATGRPAFAGGHIAAIMDAVRTGEPDLDGVPARLRTLLADCLAKDPRSRPTLGKVLSVLTGRTLVMNTGEDGRPAAREATSAPPRTRVETIHDDGAPAAPTLETGVLGTFDGDVSAVALARLDGRPIAVIAADKAVRVWDLATRAPIGEPMTGHISVDFWNTVIAVAVTRLGTRTIAVSGGGDGTVRLWDLAARAPVGEPMTGQTGPINRVVIGKINNRAVAVSRGNDSVWVWDLELRTPIGKPITDRIRRINTVAIGQVNGRTVAVTGGNTKVRVWDLHTRTPIGRPLSGHTGPVNSAAIGRINSGMVAVTGGRAKVRLWDLHTRLPIGELAGHTGGVVALAIGELGGRPIAVSGSYDGTARVWDLNARTLIGRPLTGHNGPVWTVAVGQVGENTIAVTGSNDGTARLWNLNSHLR